MDQKNGLGVIETSVTDQSQSVSDQSQSGSKSSNMATIENDDERLLNRIGYTQVSLLHHACYQRDAF